MKYILIIFIFIPLLVFGQLNLDNDENIVYYDSAGGLFHIYKNTKKNSFLVTDYEEEKILLKGLKYFGNLNGSIFQALDKKYNVIYFNEKLEKIKRPLITYVVCGSGTVYYIEITEEDESYIVNKFSKKYILNAIDKKDTLSTFKFPKNNYDKIYLINGKKQLEYPDHDIYPMLVIFEEGLSYGVISNDKTEYYDDIRISGKYLKVKRNGLWNIFNFSPKVKYKVLNEFIDNLAYFELPNGKIGYLDKQGTEYYK
ncbi:hypothetical protein [Mesonia aestuariivivens]|uniref:WG repeat-containing protein n=1 Tax=Mesonia aestuariivivens TaxID=2796128 RepID=A0ABS6W5D4_9FLAO|nr:hypothetical protein [Mesonia aestuariivivens]MBW2963078.1 hypothetical protein [Mesonia aestuariivivens]